MRRLRAFISIIMVLAVSAAHAAAASTYSPLNATAQQLAAANLFISNFTETGIDSLDAYGDDMELVDFAHDHLWFNDYDSFEYGDYFGGNNCRVSDGRIQEIIDKYMYYPRQVDLSQTRFDYVDGYYYHEETGGWISDGFAHVMSICPIGDDMYFVSFMVFGGGYAWDNSVMDDTLEQVESSYGHPNGYGSALIYASDLSDRSTYRMISYARV